MVSVETIKQSDGTVIYRGQIEEKGHSVQSGFFDNRSDAEAWVKKTEMDIIVRDLMLEVKG